MEEGDGTAQLPAGRVHAQHTMMKAIRDGIAMGETRTDCARNEALGRGWVLVHSRLNRQQRRGGEAWKEARSVVLEMNSQYIWSREEIRKVTVESKI